MSITGLCALFGYSKQAYYKHRQHCRAAEDHRLKAKELVLEIRKQMPRLGTRKLYYLLSDEFRQSGLGIGRDKLFSLLREEQLLIHKRRNYTKTTDSRHWMKKYPNIVSTMAVTRPEQVWVADITYLPTRSGFTYLHLVTDAYSKRIMGYEVSDSLAASSSLRALAMALGSRTWGEKPLIHHSDRGLQYCSSDYIGRLRLNGITPSMTQNSDPYENAVAERVNGILKDEFGLGELFDDTLQAQELTRQAIMLYNAKRPHLSCQMLTPDQMHKQDILPLKRWKKKTSRTVVQEVHTSS